MQSLSDGTTCLGIHSAVRHAIFGQASLVGNDLQTDRQTDRQPARQTDSHTDNLQGLGTQVNIDLIALLGGPGA